MVNLDTRVKQKYFKVEIFELRLKLNLLTK